MADFHSAIYSVPFDYYFEGSNPRIAIPGFDRAVGANDYRGAGVIGRRRMAGQLEGCDAVKPNFPIRSGSAWSRNIAVASILAVLSGSRRRLCKLMRDYAACEVCGIAIEPAPTRIGRITRL